MQHLVKLIIVAFAASTLGFSGATFSQDRSQDDIKAEVLAQILADRKDIGAQINAITERLPEIIGSIEKAHDTFNQIIKTLKAKAELGNPDKAFVKKIDQLIEMANADASEARTEGYLDYEKEFLEQSQGFMADRQTAVQMYDALDRRIRAVEKNRTRYIFILKLKRYVEARELVKSGLKILKEADDQLEVLEKNIDDEIAN